MERITECGHNEIESTRVFPENEMVNQILFTFISCSTARSSIDDLTLGEELYTEIEIRDG
jgi:hypothetical protein